MLNLLVIILLSYLVGSIPTGILVARSAGNIDIRNHGSGNMGGTNIMRVLGWKYGVLVILLDALKGAFTVVVISRLYLGSFPFPNQTPFDDFTLVQIIAGVIAVVGHIWTIFAEFKGGKGIATGMGILITLVSIDIFIAFGIFLLIVAISRYVSLASIIATSCIPIIMIIRTNIFHVNIIGYGTLLPFVIFIALLVMFTHRANIKRLLSGKESKISFSKKK